RLFAQRAEAADGAFGIELLLVEKLGERTWEVLAKPGKRVRPGAVLALGEGLSAEVIALRDDGRREVRFSSEVEPYLDRLGHVPLPPYIKRADDAADRERYQTVFAKHPGAIAAPTAGLHLSNEILSQLSAAGIGVASLTLHVGIGTFKPVTAELVHEHRMEKERWEIDEETAAAIERTRARGGRVVAIGTTVVRALESAAAEPGSGGEIRAGSGATRLFITPGYSFRAVDVLMTNFHLPCSTLLMLVSAFAGRERILAAYREAIDAGYRFYSYGDAMLVERVPPDNHHDSPGTR
ncbi:MAG TPA: tRNA preQ1(34) S-adenosylmethionine ribosyltransferase-isomerase QueA, partial [Thermoanaerobaculia bacterium]|nr:tRNA preQ1(34) S-adenosylmethionine ribosyltransferase-isomerase QueA [Thermoanaerobaculia bacterium]